LIFGVYLIWEQWAGDDESNAAKEIEAGGGEKSERERNFILRVPRPALLLLFFLPFLLCFLISNVVKLAPWEWDNIKVLIYWFIGAIPFAAFVLARLWNRDKILKIVALGCLFV
jgi:hypothetical protein